jgi:hypothetical protein
MLPEREAIASPECSLRSIGWFPLPHHYGEQQNAAFQFDRRAGFPVPTWTTTAMARNAGDGRSAATRSHAQRALAREHGEDGEHRTFPEVSTMARSDQSAIGQRVADAAGH